MLCRMRPQELAEIEAWAALLQQERICTGGRCSARADLYRLIPVGSRVDVFAPDGRHIGRGDVLQTLADRLTVYLYREDRTRFVRPEECRLLPYDEPLGK